MLRNLQTASIKAISIAAITVFSLTAVLVPAQASSHQTDIRLAATDTDAIAVNPATNGTADKSRTRFDYQLNPGQPARDSIYVVNTGSSVQEVTLYARDAFSGPKGDFLIQDQSVEATDVGSWVTFADGESSYKFTLKPKGFVTVPFNVLTPTNATPGDHIGAVIASSVTKGKNLNIVRRVAVRLYARLSGQVQARLKLENVYAKTYPNPFNPFASNEIVTYDISNTGNVELAADVSITTSGPFGLFGSAPQTVRVTNLLPGSKRHISQTVSGSGQLLVTTSSVVFAGLLSSSSVASQQPRGRVDVTSTSFPIGWMIWLPLIAVALFISRILSSRSRRARQRGRAREEAS